MNNMTSMQRVTTAISHREPDRVPLFLFLTMHGARELGIGIKDYFSKGGNVVEGQMRLLKKFGHDCLYPFFYAAVEVEAWGGQVIYLENGPPNAGPPIIKSALDISSLLPPDVGNAPCLGKVLEAISGLKARVGDSVPIIGVVMSPFSLPVMQMGFEAYLELMHGQPETFWHLMRINEKFCVDWAKAQIKAGANAICYFDPVSSPTVIPRKLFRKTGFVIAQRMHAAINFPIAMHMASGRCLGISDLLPQTGAAVVGVSAEDDLADLKRKFSGKITILGNFNGLEMRRWDAGQAETAVKSAVAKAGRGGGLILSDNHGEIPWQVPENVLTAVSQATREWGRYPLRAYDD